MISMHLKFKILLSNENRNFIDIADLSDLFEQLKLDLLEGLPHDRKSLADYLLVIVTNLA